MHRYTRIATGWTESACIKGDENETGERDDLDGLSEEQLLAIKLNQSERVEPVGAHSEANDQATAGVEQRGSKLPKLSWGFTPWGLALWCEQGYNKVDCGVVQMHYPQHNLFVRSKYFACIKMAKENMTTKTNRKGLISWLRLVLAKQKKVIGHTRMPI